MEADLHPFKWVDNLNCPFAFGDKIVGLSHNDENSNRIDNQCSIGPILDKRTIGSSPPSYIHKGLRKSFVTFEKWGNTDGSKNEPNQISLPPSAKNLFKQTTSPVEKLRFYFLD